MKIIIVFLAIIGVSFPAFSATFILKYGSTNLSSIYVYVFQNGKLITSGSTSSTGTVSFTLPTGNYSYKTSTNFIGDISSSSSVTLYHRKFTLTLKDNASNPISSETIRIYEDGVEAVSSKSTNSSGICEFYLKPSDKYAYKTSYNQAAFSLENDLSLALTKDIVCIIAKYLNYPIADNFTLYSYGDKNTSIGTGYSSSSDGEVIFNVSTGKYWLKNKLNIYTELDITNETQLFVLNYKKVRFISNKTDPNILESIVVSNGGYSSDTRTTDGKGYADFYLLTGTYTYSHLAMSESFTVTNDTTINLNTQTVTINLKNAVTLIPYPNQPFKVGKDMNSLTSYTTNSSGTCQIKLQAGNYVFSDGISSYPFTISSYSKIITPPLYDVTFNITQNLENATLNTLSITSTNTKNTVYYNSYENGMKLCLLSGDYKFSCFGEGFSIIQLPFKVNKNTNVSELFTFQLLLTDNNNIAVSGQTYYIKQDGSYIYTSLTTNNEGSAIVYLPNGTYQLYNIRTQEETSFEINNQNKTLNILYPNEVTLTVKQNGQMINTGYVMISNEHKTVVQSIQIINGTGKARLHSGSSYFVQLSASGVVSLQSKITVSSNSVDLDFMSLQIKSEGRGIVFPYQTDENNLVYYLKQSPIRLVAVPMKGWTCTKWVINEININDDLIDYTINVATIATAIFEQNTPNDLFQLKSISNTLNLTPNPADTQINFSEELSGNAVIYNTEGKIMKQIYIYGNSINVSDLIAGIYIISIETENETYKGNFIKK